MCRSWVGNNSFATVDADTFQNLTTLEALYALVTCQSRITCADTLETVPR